MSLLKARRERMLELASGFDNIIVLDPKNLFYLTDFWGGGIGIVRPDSTVVVTSLMEERRAQETCREAEIVSAYGKAAMGEAAKKILAKGRTLMDTNDEGIKGVVDPDFYVHARRRKDREEIGRIAEASKRMDRLYALLEERIRPGVTERALAAEVVKEAMMQGLSPLGAEGSLSPIIVGSGENSAYPHVELTDRKLKVGDLVIADIFFRYKGYCSDCTRTFGVGKVSKERRAGYDAVLEAENLGVRLVKDGASGREIHESVKEALGRHDLARYFPHGTGHGVGIDIHEQPSLGGKSTDVLKKGDVVTVEPGIYLPGQFGVRIEDTLVVGERTDVLTAFARDLIIV